MIFIDEIEFQQQPTYNTCVSACLAMVLGEPVDLIISEYHDKYWGAGDDKVWPDEYLESKGVPIVLCNHKTKPDMAGVYFVTVPSLNIKGGTHQILWCIENAEQEGFFYQRILDPASGREGKFYYTNIDELLASDELATKVSGYACDFFIPKEYFVKSNQINELQS